MFTKARFKLTAWYVVIILIISTLFSIAFYNASTREIDRIIDRLEFERQHSEFRLFRPLRSSNAPSIEELLSYKERMRMTLLFVNGLIFIFSAGAAYFLAGRTLRPIKIMVDEQNQFISNASHELRTPIATLRAEMEGKLLEKRISDKAARKLITSNLEELGRLQNLANDLLKLAQTHTINNDENKQEMLSLLEVIKTAYNKVSPLAKQKKIKITIKSVENIIKGDKNSLIELFVILFDNAIKYSSENSEITVTSEITEHKTKIAIADQGIGISKEDLPHIFERFFRADKSRSMIDGYGLGLSIAKKIVEAHRGSIDVDSKISKGSTFKVIMPLA